MNPKPFVGLFSSLRMEDACKTIRLLWGVQSQSHEPGTLRNILLAILRLLFYLLVQYPRELELKLWEYTLLYN